MKPFSLFILLILCTYATTIPLESVAAPQAKTSTKKTQASKQTTAKKSTGKPSATQQKKASQPIKQSGNNKKTSSSQASKKTRTNSKKTQTNRKTTSEPRTSADAKKQQQATQREIKQTEEQIRQNDIKIKDGLNELGRLQSDISVSQSKIQASRTSLDKLEAQISSLSSEISTNEQQLKKLRDEYMKAVKKMRLTMKNRSELAFIFASDNFNQALRRARYLRQFSHWRDQQTVAIAAATASLRKQQDQLAVARTQQASLLKEQQLQEQTLQTQKQHQDLVVNQLKQNGAALKSHLARKQAEANALNARIASLIAAEQKKAEEDRKRKEAEAAKKVEEERKRKEAQAKKEAESQKLADAKQNTTRQKERNPKTTTQKDTKQQQKNKQTEQLASATKIEKSSENTPKSYGSQGFAAMKGKLPRPVSGEFKITSRFGRQSLPDLPDVVYENPGIDAEVASGASAIAVYEGKVSGVYMLPGYHTVVIVNHGNYYTVYGNISSPSVSVGQEVSAGHRLGTIAPDEDNQNRSSIHFEVWRNRDKLNPMEWLR